LFHDDAGFRERSAADAWKRKFKQRAIQSLRTGEASTIDLLLDHDLAGNDGLICGGKVMGVIVPNAQNAGADFWNELAARRQVFGLGRERIFPWRALARGKTPPPRRPDWVYQENRGPGLARYGWPAPAYRAGRGSRWPGNWILT